MTGFIKENNLARIDGYDLWVNELKIEAKRDGRFLSDPLLSVADSD